MRDTIAAEIEDIFRRESRRLISVLTRILGPRNLELAEDVMQESFVAALREWTRRTFAADLALYLDSEWTLARTVGEAFEENWIHDDQLRMIFMCCHPRLPVESRVTLILKTLCGANRLRRAGPPFPGRGARAGAQPERARADRTADREARP